ncbi:MAG: hypothetical protein AB1730_23710 [Myxococcota bacterium]
MMRLLVALVAGALLAGCATFSPRFDQDVATTFVQDDMRHVETELLDVYYPAGGRDAALRVAARAEECLRAFRSLQRTTRARDKALLFLTSANYNNAYVSGQSGGEPLHSLTPLSATSELFHWYGLSSADVGDIACHEMFHYAHFEQVENVWRGVNAVFGPVVPSQAFLERWFTEGVAQYYEGRLGRPVGRPHSPLYRGSFDSFFVKKGGLGGGDLTLFQRELSPYSGAYLTGLFFVEWLVETYGEEKLWQLMDLQGRSFFVPFGVALRFKAAYGHELGELLFQFEGHLLETVRPRERPATQAVVRPALGQLARLAGHGPSGTLALVTSGNEEVPMLRILEADGRVRAERKLVRLTTDRDWILVGPGVMSGLSFTADGRWLYLVNDDLIARGDTRSQIWKVDAETGETVQVWQQVGRMMGGGVAPDGRSYLTVEFPAGASRIVDVELATGAQTVLVSPPAGVAVSAPQWSPDKRRIVFSRMDRQGWNLVLREADGTLKALTTDGAFNYGARWTDETHVVFARTAGKYLQVHRLDVDSGALEQLTDAPWGVVDPTPAGARVAFVNRDGSQWSLDTSPLAPVATGAQAEEKSPPSDDAAADSTPAPDLLSAQPSPPMGERETWYEPPALTLEGDEPYSSIDHLFLPQLRAPGVAAAGITADGSGAARFYGTLTAALAGRDRLARHNWLISGALTVPTLENVVSASYRNLQLAPWFISAYAGREGYPETATTSAETYWSGGVTAGRTVFTTPIAFGVRAEVWQPQNAAIGKYFGPWLSVSYGASEGTGYGGTQRLLSLSLDVSGYPRALGSDSNLLDVGAEVAVAFPLPLSKRHSFVLSLVGRALPGAPSGALRVGGVARGTALWTSAQGVGRAGKPPDVFLPGSFVEVVRGYDDFSIRATAAGVAHARYRYSFIIDKGFTSTAWVLPGAFFRQIDLDLFGSAAATDNPQATWSRAAGAALSLRTAFGGALPLSLSYQFAWRFDHGLPPLHVLSASFD